ncbi:hypothetical protein QTP86_010893 [Hemibagrus guttatus]|nr:hypothetical protein QTP86_010893 [Hemibagrus guttatus]
MSLIHESKFEVLFGKLGRHVIRTKEGKDNPSCYQRSVQKPASRMVWGCMSACGMGSLHIWKGTINAERNIVSSPPDSVLRFQSRLLRLGGVYQLPNELLLKYFIAPAMYHQAAQQIGLSQKYNKMYFDQDVHNHKFELGDVVMNFLTNRSRDVAMGPGSGPSGDGDDARVPRTATSPTFWHKDETISRGADQQPPMGPCSSTSKSNSLVSRHG